MRFNDATWIEWIPNISTGEARIVDLIATTLSQIPQLYILHIDRSEEVNRTVVTAAGTKDSLKKGLKSLVDILDNTIDMSIHRGTHPRLGALDVSPYVLLKNGTVDELKNWVSIMAQEISNYFALPVYLYERSATHPLRISLSAIRKGEYEGLDQKLKAPEWKPDFGGHMHRRLGASVLGVRDFLIAYNVNLNTPDLRIAKAIAREIRTVGGPHRIHALPGLKAIGWRLEKSGFCQVSTNITRTTLTTPLDVYKHCENLAKHFGCQVTGSELIGLIPLHSIEKMQSSEPLSTKELSMRLGLDYCKVEDLKDRIIEHKVYIASGRSLFNEIFDTK